VFPVRDLFEGHLKVADLDRAIAFYRDTLGLELAQVFRERHVAFFWIGGKGKAMLGLWESAVGPSQLIAHLAFQIDLADVLASPQRLREAGIVPLDLAENPTDEPVVLSWMPAAAVYFKDPDGNLLEFITMLEGDRPRSTPDVVPWSQWNGASATSA
jgi:lactoylglutathione lyase